MSIRYAQVISKRGEDEVAQYLPANYRVIGTKPSADFDGYTEVLVAGEDNAGWTLDDYVLPRLGSGLISGKETGNVEAQEFLGGRNEDKAWEDAYGISYIGASNPKGVQRTWLTDAARLGEDHPAVRAIKGHLDFLHGSGIGPEFDDLGAVKDNARRLGIEDADGNYVPAGERHKHHNCQQCGCVTS